MPAIDIAIWVATKLLNKATDGVSKRVKRALLGSPVDLALIAAVRTGVSEATAQVWAEDPDTATAWRQALLEHDAVTWPLVDGTDLADLPGASTLWVSTVDHPVGVDGSPEHLTVDSPLIAPLCEEILKAIRHNATRGDGQLKGLWDDFRITQLDKPLDQDSGDRLDPVAVFLADFENYLEGFGPGVAGLEALLERIPQGMWPIIEGVANSSAQRFVDDHDLGDTVVFNYSSPLEPLAFLLKNAWETGYFLHQFHRYGRLPSPRGSVDPMVIMDRTVGMASGVAGVGVHIEVFLQKAVSLRTEPEAIRRACFAPFTTDDLERLLQPRFGQWTETMRTVYGHGLLVAQIEEDSHQLD